MKKKALIITAISILIICLISTFSFATQEGGVVGNVVDDAGDMARNAGEMVSNVAEDGMDMIEDGANMVGEGITDGANTMSNGMVNSQTLNDIGGDAKNATDTMTDRGVLDGNAMSANGFLGMNNSVWLWIILIIIIIAVIVFICKYMQKNDNNNLDDDDDDE